MHRPGNIRRNPGLGIKEPHAAQNTENNRYTPKPFHHLSLSMVLSAHRLPRRNFLLIKRLKMNNGGMTQFHA
jgi:hypothetical protein